MFGRRRIVLLARGCGIVGLPNIGKSTLFNALTRSQMAKTGNYPFCTINANLAKVDVYDERARKLAAFTGAQKIVDVDLDLADVAGLIAGAHKGEGLGNKFLADVRPVSVILHMVRCFEDEKEGFDKPDPLASIAVIENELVLSDLEVTEKRAAKLLKSKKPDDIDVAFVTQLKHWLEDGKPARSCPAVTSPRSGPLEKQLLSDLQLLSAKPVLFVLNVDEGSMVAGNAHSKVVESKFGAENTIRICSLIEEQTAQFSREERLTFLKDGYGISEPVAEQLLRKVLSMLKMQAFFTVGPKMVHAWSVPVGATAKEAAGVIHTDFQTHFRVAKVHSWKDLLTYPTLAEAERTMRVVGAEHKVQDGDVLIIEHTAEKR